jgi:hypothetical protein
MQELLTWSKGLPGWQRDALRRLCQGGQLQDHDYEELTELCLGRHAGMGPIPRIEPEPLASSHVRPAIGGHTIALKAISHVANVNALADGQKLSFGTDGLTVVYGGNGSGKSGYGRILKSACRARDHGGRILPDAYARQPGGPASAKITYSLDGVVTSTDWQDGSGADHVLSAVNVFDTECAPIHVEEANDVAYTPAALALLGQLADACREVKRRIGLRQTSLQAAVPRSLAKPKCSPGSSVATMLAGLGSAGDFARFEGVARLSADEAARLSTLRTELSADPSKTIEKLKSLQQRAKQLRARVEALEALAGDSGTQRFLAQMEHTHAAAQAAQIAASDAFRGDPLPGPGTNAWRVMWESARAYSIEAAYPGLAFPVVEDGARCVLCQQLLEQDSVHRLRRFEEFVRADTQTKATTAQAALRTLQAQLRRGQMSGQEERDAIRLVSEELERTDIGSEVRTYLTVARWRIRRYARASDSPSGPIEPTAVRLPIDRIDGLIADLGDRITAVQSERESEGRRKLELELAELDDRVWLGSVLDDVRTDIERRKQLSVLGSALGDCETRGITNKATALADGLVTKALRDRFAQEVLCLGGASLRAELVQAGSQYGVPKFRVSLVANPAADVGTILSEGEHRCVAIAAFLAELATCEDRSAIVLDDPVCSLDEDHREQVAARLVEEAKNRQVVVFTHDVVFVSMLKHHADSEHVPVVYQNVTRANERPGVCTDDPPLSVKPVADAARGLGRHLKQVSGLADSGHVDKWALEAASIAGQLRQLWERAVEEVLSPVYRRFDSKVKTPGLIKTTVITEADCQAMREAFRWCSTHEHSQPLALGSKPPTVVELAEKLDDLHRWLADIQSRQAAVQP